MRRRGVIGRNRRKNSRPPFWNDSKASIPLRDSSKLGQTKRVVNFQKRVPKAKSANKNQPYVFGSEKTSRSKRFNFSSGAPRAVTQKNNNGRAKPANITKISSFTVNEGMDIRKCETRKTKKKDQGREKGRKTRREGMVFKFKSRTPFHLKAVAPGISF